MAKSKNNDDELTVKIKGLKKRSVTHFIVAIVLFLMLSGFLVKGLNSMVEGHKLTVSMIAEKPDNLMVSFDKKIKKTKILVKDQYAKHIEKMERKNVLDLHDKFKTLYSLSEQSETEYVKLLQIYNQLSYEQAGRIRGTAEWYFYQKKKSEELFSLALKRRNKLVKYFKDE